MSITFTGPVPVPAKQTTPLHVLITGASRGIGFELARQYTEAHKDNVVFAAVRDVKSKNSEAVNALAAKHSNLHVIPLDTSKEQNIRDSVTYVTKVTDHLDIVYNNAGIGGARDPLTATFEQLHEPFDTNVAGSLVVVQTYIDLLRKSTIGSKVINVSSALGSNPYAFAMGQADVAYGISKAALNYANTVLKHAVPDVTFLSISPGWVNTDGGSRGGSPPTKVEDCVQAIRYYTDVKTIKNSGEFFDIMTGEILPF